MPNAASEVATVSASWPRLSAAIVPAISDKMTAINSAITPMKIVFGRRAAISPEIGRSLATVSDKPKSPRTIPCSQRPY